MRQNSIYFLEIALEDVKILQPEIPETSPISLLNFRETLFYDNE